MFVQKVITDVFAEVGAFRIGIEKVLKVLRWEVELAINLATVESQIKPSALNNVSRRSQSPGLYRHPVDRRLHFDQPSHFILQPIMPRQRQA